MGIVTFGAPHEIIEKIRRTFQVSTFVETGTYLGGTAGWASEHFEHVFTIEGSPDLSRQAQERLSDKRNIEFLIGDSRSKLQEVVKRLGNTPALFWLDAHWMPGSFGEAHECPLLKEIAAIHESTADHFILIDDARLFLAPPPLPHRAQDWPDIASVLSALTPPAHSVNYTVVYRDVIISLPSTARETMQQFYQEQITAEPQDGSRPVIDLVAEILGRTKRRFRKIAGQA